MILFIIFYYILPTYALEEVIWVKKEAPTIYQLNGASKNSLVPSTDPKIKAISKDFEIKNPIMLNDKAQPYEKNKGQKPFTSEQGIIIGFYHEGQLWGIDAKDITTNHPRGPVTVKRTPKAVSLQCSDCSPNKNVINNFLMNIEETIDEELTSGESLELIKLVYEFHNSSCDSQRGNIEKASMEDEITNYKKEWTTFVAEKTKKGQGALAEKAMALDMLARTVAFESHKMGELEELKPEVCSSSSDCPQSSCEKLAISHVISERARNDLNKAVKVATHPRQFNIWDPQWTHSYFTSCFLKKGLQTGTLENLDEKETTIYRNWIRQFKSALNAVNTVWDKDKAKKVYNVDSKKPVKHYYHPYSMVGCDPETYDHIYSSNAYYISTKEQNPEYELILGNKIYIEEEEAKKDLAQFQFYKYRPWSQRDEARKNGFVNVSYYLEKPADKKTWFVDTKQIEQVKSRNICAPMGLGSVKNKIRTCDKNQIKGKQYYQAPSWSYLDNAESVTFKCRFQKPSDKPKKEFIEVEVGGACDYRFHPLAGVR